MREDPFVLDASPLAPVAVSTCIGAADMSTQPWWEGEWHGSKLAYNLCPAGLALFHLDLGNEGAREGPGDEEGGSHHTVGYFSSAGELGSGYHPEVLVATVAAHGGLRNADAYFCAVNGMASLAGMPASSVAVFAPRFLYYADGPMDAPTWDESSELWWNGSKPFGDWRSGGEADPDATQEQGFSTSSYLVLDKMVGALLEDTAGAYPRLQRVIVLGHSAGGQLVHRYALARKGHRGVGYSPPFAPPSLLGVDDSRTGQQLPRVGQRFRELRFMVMNPSSFTYPDEQRWDAAHGRLIRPPELDISQCQEYNDWHYGLGGALTPYVGGLSLTSSVANYGVSDVRYLVGEEDTCNADDSPGCNEHTLDKRCPALLEGRNRRERATLYHACVPTIDPDEVPPLLPPWHTPSAFSLHPDVVTVQWHAVFGEQVSAANLQPVCARR
jgi:pimeloyl-ACP methyl ester carboxylesterase